MMSPRSEGPCECPLPPKQPHPRAHEPCDAPGMTDADRRRTIELADALSDEAYRGEPDWPQIAADAQELARLASEAATGRGV